MKYLISGPLIQLNGGDWVIGCESVTGGSTPIQIPVTHLVLPSLLHKLKDGLDLSSDDLPTGESLLVVQPIADQYTISK